jgi:hypothetical protein
VYIYTCICMYTPWSSRPTLSLPTPQKPKFSKRNGRPQLRGCKHGQAVCDDTRGWTGRSRRPAGRQAHTHKRISLSLSVCTYTYIKSLLFWLAGLAGFRPLGSPRTSEKSTKACFEATWLSQNINKIQKLKRLVATSRPLGLPRTET